MWPPLQCSQLGSKGCVACVQASCAYVAGGPYLVPTCVRFGEIDTSPPFLVGPDNVAGCPDPSTTPISKLIDGFGYRAPAAAAAFPPSHLTQTVMLYVMTMMTFVMAICLFVKWVKGLENCCRTSPSPPRSSGRCEPRPSPHSPVSQFMRRLSRSVSRTPAPPSGRLAGFGEGEVDGVDNNALRDLDPSIGHRLFGRWGSISSIASERSGSEEPSSINNTTISNNRHGFGGTAPNFDRLARASSVPASLMGGGRRTVTLPPSRLATRGPLSSTQTSHQEDTFRANALPPRRVTPSATPIPSQSTRGNRSDANASPSSGGTPPPNSIPSQSNSGSGSRANALPPSGGPPPQISIPSHPNRGGAGPTIPASTNAIFSIGGRCAPSGMAGRSGINPIIPSGGGGDDAKLAVAGRSLCCDLKGKDFPHHHRGNLSPQSSDDIYYDTVV